MKPESNRPITIEDLLRLKRAERPPAEFWTDFDRTLRAKQLAALVEKRPWWQTVPQIFSGLYRYRIALGATAVCALTFFSLRSYTSSPTVAPAQHADMVAVALPQVETGLAALAVAESVPVPGPIAVAAAVTPPPAVVSAPRVEEVAAGVGAFEPSGVVALGAAAVSSGPESESELPAARQVAAAFASVQTPERLASHRLLGAATGFEARAMPARAAVEPLQQMTPPSDSRRSRMLTAMVSTASLETSAQTTERAASRMISEERIYDQIHRFGARGDRLQVKF
ncbi:hypothetical protein [Horticoccus sp. 23ND18S-11]